MDLFGKLPLDLRVVIVTGFLDTFKLRRGRLMQQLRAEQKVILQLALAVSGCRTSVHYCGAANVCVVLCLPEYSRYTRVLFKFTTAENYRVDTFTVENNYALTTITDYVFGSCC